MYYIEVITVLSVLLSVCLGVDISLDASRPKTRGLKEFREFLSHSLEFNLALCLQVSSARLGKQLGPRSGPTKRQDLGPNFFNNLWRYACQLI